ncbi:MAG: hypothetical protein ACXU82_02705 [Caulobacteraceae bacterium]
MRRIAPLALGLMIAVAPVEPALAAEPPPAAAQTIALEAVALPIIVDGRLLNYVFCSIRLDLYPNADGAKVRAKEEYFRDDLVRVGHRNPFVRKDDYNRVDEAKVRAEILRIAPGLVGPGVIRSAAIVRQASQKVMGAPPSQQTGSREIVP